MTTIYLNGVQVNKDDIKKTEIKIERVKELLSKKLTKKE